MPSMEPRPEEALLSLAFTGFPTEAMRGLQKLLVDEAQRASVWTATGIAAAIAGELEISISALQQARTLSPSDVLASAYLGVVLEACGRNQEACAILDHAGCILRQPLFDEVTAEDLGKFNRNLLDHILAHPTRAWQPAQKATHGGWQTGELMNDDAEVVLRLKAALRRIVDDLTDASPGAPGLPITAWAVALGRNGYQEPHVHQAGIISGVYYVQVPADSGDTGLLRFPRSLPWVKTAVPAGAPYVLRPSAGDIVVFPSYFWHETSPLASDGLRVSVAFDVLKES